MLAEQSAERILLAHHSKRETLHQLTRSTQAIAQSQLLLGRIAVVQPRVLANDETESDA